MLIHVNSKDVNIEDKLVNLQEAFYLLENQSIFTEMDDNFIGFTQKSNHQVIIQFTRHSQKEWLLDIPTYSESLYAGSLSSPVLHDLVFTIVRDFFDENSKIRSLIAEYQYKQIITMFESNYKLSLKLL